MANQKIDLQLKGLFTAPNLLSGIPPGALEIADNVVINSKNLIDSRRGQTQYGDPLTLPVDTQVNKLFNYSSSLIVNYADKMAYDAGDGVWMDYSGTYTQPDPDYKMRSLEALKNFYFTTSRGVYKLDSLTATPRPAGAPRALGGTYIFDGSSGFLLDDSAVAYRIVWGYRDANQNLILGAPSQRLVVSNNTGGSKDVILTYIIPDTITTEYFYQIYRSNGTASASDEPTDELQLVIEGNPDSGQIAARSFSVTDITPYSLMRASLYTNPSQEGIANANVQPPFALDMDVFKGCAFYANIRQKQTLSLAIISIGSPSLGYVTDATVDTHTNLILDSITTTANLRVGMRAIGTGIQADSRIASIDSATQVTLTKATTASATVSVEFQDRFTIGGVDYWAGSSQNVALNQFFADTSSTPGVNINDSAVNLVEIINKSASNTTIYAYYISALEDLPGQILFEERNIGGSAFSATSTAGTSFSPVLPPSGTSVVSDNEASQNRVIISKSGQVEAVPVYRFFNIGSANFPIQRVVALRDGIFFFKPDGIYRLSGETFESFTVTLVDNTVSLKVPESAVPFNNQVFCFTTQGIVAVQDSGVRIMSVPIEDTLLELSSDQFTNFASASFGVAYESARQYMFFTVSIVSDTVATQAFIYNSLTDSWTRWEMRRTCGLVNTAINKLFMAQADTGQILIERKNYTNADYADEQYPVTIVSVDSDTQVTLADVTNVKAGMTLVQGSRNGYIEFVDGLVLTLTPTKFLVPGAAEVYTPIASFIQWAPIDVENPGILKQFSEISLFFKNAAFREIDAGFATNASLSSTIVAISNTSLTGTWGGFPWGGAPWGGVIGGATVLRTYVPREKQRGSWLTLSLGTEEAFTGFSLQGVSLIFNPMSSRLR